MRNGALAFGHAVQLYVRFRAIVQHVTREIRRYLHVELHITFAHIAAQDIRTAADIEAQALTRLQHDWPRCQAEPECYRFARRQGLGYVDIDRDLGRGAACSVDRAACGSDRTHRQKMVGA